jgi:4Fe-4S ferredoxin
MANNSIVSGGAEGTPNIKGHRQSARGVREPRVDRARCEGKGACVRVCPYDVFEVRQIVETEYRALSLVARVKLWLHGKRTAYTPRADACQSCGLCVAACPEHAIRLVSRQDAN